MSKAAKPDDSSPNEVVSWRDINSESVDREMKSRDNLFCRICIILALVVLGYENLAILV